jgi:hypothetical protein
MAAAGAKARESAAASAQYTIKRLGPRPPRPSHRSIVIAAAVVLVAVAGVALAVVGADQTGSRSGRPRAMPTQAPPRHSAVPVPVKPASPAPSARERPRAALVDVVGVGCPGNGSDAVIPDNAPTGPGWASAGGGWTGNGCDGTTLWTMDPNGNQPVPSFLTWRFVPSPGTTRCTLAVFIPTQNALGVSDYSVSVGTGVVDAVLIRQGAESGRWLTLGTFTAAGGALEITTAPVPAASGRGHHSAIAASAASALCT